MSAPRVSEGGERAADIRHEEDEKDNHECPVFPMRIRSQEWPYEEHGSTRRPHERSEDRSRCQHGGIARGSAPQGSPEHDPSGHNIERR